jgi:prevent-host-death family protein
MPKIASYSTSDLSRKSGNIIAEALRKPVTITQRNKPGLVLLSIEDYRELTEWAGTREADAWEDAPVRRTQEGQSTPSEWEGDQP